MEDVAPLVAEGALPSNPEVQSPTVIIDDVLNDLAPEVGTAETYKVKEEEEGFSLTPEEDDNEEGNANNED